MLPAPKKKAKSMKPNAIISVNFKLCFTDSPYTYNLLNVVFTFGNEPLKNAR